MESIGGTLSLANARFSFHNFECVDKVSQAVVVHYSDLSSWHLRHGARFSSERMLLFQSGNATTTWGCCFITHTHTMS